MISFISGSLSSLYRTQSKLNLYLRAIPKWLCCAFVVIFLVQLAIHPGSASSTTKHSVILAEGVVGGAAKLQCKVTQDRSGNSPILFLWYKDGNRRPLYTLDLRRGGPSEFFEEGMRSRVESDESGQWLTLRPLIASDTGQYKCLVSFENSPTMAALVNLTVYEPPTQLLIVNETNNVQAGPVIGPINEDSSLKLNCIAIGGNPRPTVAWWFGDNPLSDRSPSQGSLLSSQEDDELDIRGRMESDVRQSVTRRIEIRPLGRFSTSISSNSLRSYEAFPFGVGKSEFLNSLPKVISQLNIPKVDREHLGANVTCKAFNNNISQPLTKTLALNVYLKPLTVNIHLPKDPLVENNQARIKCEAAGSRPPAKISWVKSDPKGKMFLEATNTISDGKTSSWLVFTPTANDHNAELSCRASNPYMPDRDSIMNTVLQVQFSPRVRLRLGTNLKNLEIKEGQDVFFECDISSNPRPRITSWHKDGKLMHQELKAGVLVAGENLVLQRIHRKYAGNYTCSATNDLGTTTSNNVELPIMFLPVCSSEHVTVAVVEGESVRLNCRVDARPSKDLTFIWLFNNTLDTVEVGNDRVEVEGRESIINYTPHSPRDYGTLSCWATNNVGMQAEPCRFTVVEAGPPEKVRNCVLVNHTVGALEVRCFPGTKGGSPRGFIAKVYASPTHNLLIEVRNHTPRFHVAGLTPGQDYLVSITAENEKGSSEPVEIDAIRLKVAEKRMVDVNSTAVSPLVGVFLGLVGGFFLLLLIGLLLSRARSSKFNCWKYRRNTNRSSGEDQGMQVGVTIQENTQQQSPTRIHTKVSSSSLARPSLEEEEESPDLVKSSNETSQLLDTRKGPDMITRRHTYSPPMVIPTSSPITSGTTFNGPAAIASFLQPQSPRHISNLPKDESFV